MPQQKTTVYFDQTDDDILIVAARVYGVTKLAQQIGCKVGHLTNVLASKTGIGSDKFDRMLEILHEDGLYENLRALLVEKNLDSRGWALQRLSENVWIKSAVAQSIVSELVAGNPQAIKAGVAFLAHESIESILMCLRGGQSE